MTTTKKHADELLKKASRKVKPLVLTRRDTDEDAARRAGYPSVEVMLSTQEAQRRKKAAGKREAEAREKKEWLRRKTALVNAKNELKERLSFQSQHGNRVRAAIKDPELGRRVVKENEENNRKILELKGEIKQLAAL